MDPDTLGIGIFSPVPPEEYRILNGGICANGYTLSPFTKYCEFLGTIDIGPYTAYTYEYTTCTGIQESGSGVCNVPFSGSCQIGISKCIRSGSLVITGDATGNIVTGSLSYCGFYEDPTPYTGSRTPVEIQEYNYNRTSTLNSRYAGAKNSSAKYNVFTKGDQSYPGYATIDNYVGYTGLFTNVESSSYFPDQMTIKLTYLSDTSGGLNDLNLQNNNWVYMQNIYKPNSTVTIKQFNATEFSNQYYLDKQFKVVESGYSYQPYWYRSDADEFECYRSEFAGNSGSSQLSFTAYKSPDSYGDLLNFEDRYPPVLGVDFPFIPTGSSEPDTSGSANDYQLSLFAKEASNGGANNLVPYYYEVPGSPAGTKYITGSYYNVPKDGVYTAASNLYLYITSETVIAGTSLIVPRPTPPGFGIDIYLIKNPSTASGYLDGGTVLASGVLVATSLKDYYKVEASFTNFLSKNDRLFTKVVIRDWARYWPINPAIWPSGYVATLVNPFEFYSSCEIANAEGEYCIDTDDFPLFSSSYAASSNILPITENMSQYFDMSGSTTFLPEPSSSLYPLLGDINYSTKIEPGDYIILYYNGQDLGMSASELYPISRRVVDIIEIDQFRKSIEIYPNMPAYITTANINSYKKIVFIKKQPDESVVILQGAKRPGKTSYGFLVPQDINPYILQNINTLQSSIQSQILNF